MLKTDMTNVSMILNPAAGRMQRSPDIRAAILTSLSDEGIKVLPEFTSGPGDATSIAGRAARRGDPFVIVCGGDGTINEALQALVGSETALAVWPGGTANILAKELGLPSDEKALAKMISTGKRRRVSVGSATRPGTAWQRYFILMAGIGLDAAIVRGVDPRLKKVSGYGAYVVSALGFLARLPREPFTLSINGAKHEGTFACISNALNYAGGFTLTPDASLDEPNLDVCLFNSHSRIEYLNLAFRGLTGSHTTHESVLYRKTMAVAAESSGGSVPVQLDGEVVETLPMHFECVPSALDIISTVATCEPARLPQSLNGEAFQRSTQ